MITVTKTNALRFHQHGLPKDVLRMETLPLHPLAEDEVLIRVLASPVNPSDLGTLAGSYGALPKLPAVAGREGVGEIVEAGPAANGLAPGDRVLLPEGAGGWREWMTAPARGLIPVPASIPIEQAAMASINPPTARLLLDSFVDLRPGDWVAQNAANSAVGHYLIQMARARGVHTLNFVRDPAWISRLRDLGADEVLVDEDASAQAARKLTGGRGAKLALNSVGGPSAIRLIKTLADGGTLVTFGGMTGEPVRFPTRHLIFHDIRLRGFWLNRWKQDATGEQRADLFADIFAQMADGTLRAPVESPHPLADHATALEQAARGGRRGKILFKMTDA